MLCKNGWEDPLMREDETSFLCGLLCQEKPAKVLEVGVYSGSTTAIMAQCLSNLGIGHCEICSIDLSECCDGSSERRTGYIYEMVKEHFAEKGIAHTLYTGQPAPAFLDQAGGPFDFLMLDTAHILPGELLDFISILPYLKDGAMVCVHDINLHQMHYTREKENACGILFSAVVAEKYLNRRTTASEYETGFPNIGAFRITPETRKQMDNVFLALCLRWRYFPSFSQLKLFSDVIRTHYAPELYKVFEEAIMINCESSFLLDFEGIPLHSRVILYGSGILAETIRRKILRTGYFEIIAWTAPDFGELDDPRISDPDKTDYQEADWIIVAIPAYRTFQNVREMLVKEKGVDLKKIFVSTVPFDELGTVH